jgi:tRNA (guanine-N7-)-methyltransferase
MSATKLDALATLRPGLVLDVASPTARLDQAKEFGRHGAPLVLDVGFGTGESTMAFALEHPDHDVIAVDVHTSGVARLLRALDDHRVTNVRIVEADVWQVLSRLEPASVARVHVFFPDPWPKVRHHKRRLVQAPFVAVVADRLVSDGFLHLATDWSPYAARIGDVLAADPQLEVIEHHTTDHRTAGDAAARPGRRAVTTYERRGLAAGRAVVDVVARRCPRPAPPR